MLIIKSASLLHTKTWGNREMNRSIAEKIIAKQLVEGKANSGEEIGLKIDHTLTQDSTGTMAYLEFQAISIPKIKTQLSLSFVDHNMLQNDYRNADDHRYLQCFR